MDSKKARIETLTPLKATSFWGPQEVRAKKQAHSPLRCRVPAYS